MRDRHTLELPDFSWRVNRGEDHIYKGIVHLNDKCPHIKGHAWRFFYKSDDKIVSIKLERGAYIKAYPGKRCEKCFTLTGTQLLLFDE